MKFIFAPDSFKGSLSALECCDILERVTARLFPGTETISVPVADGGEGTVEALLRAMGGTRMQTEVTGPLFERETAHWGLLSDGTAVMEMAEASGLPYVPMDRKDPRNATSLGTGEMIADALRRGVRNILIGIGGSATNDGGMGMLTALGARFTDAQGQEVSPVGGQLINVHRADFSHLAPRRPSGMNWRQAWSIIPVSSARRCSGTLPALPVPVPQAVSVPPWAACWACS